MSTKFLSPGWRMPRNANQSKSSNYSLKGTNPNIRINISSPAEVGITSSFSFWLKRTNNTVVSQPYRVVGSGLYGFYMAGTSAIYVRYGEGGSQAETFDSTATQNALALTDWVHWVITRQEVTSPNQDVKLYANGNLVDSATGTSSLGTLDSKVDSLMYQIQATDSMNSFAIFDYVLKPSQVTTLYGNSTNGVGNPMALPSPPIAYYPLGTSAYNGEYLAENNAIGDYVFDGYPGSTKLINSNINQSNTGGKFTISFWQKFNGSGLVTFNHGGGTIGEFKYFSQPIVYLASNYFQYFNIAYSTLIANTNWQHFVVFVDTTNVTNSKLWIDKTPIATAGSSTGGPANSFTSGLQLNLGAYPKISNMMYFTNYEIDQANVDKLYGYGSPLMSTATLTQAPNAWYKLDASEVYNSSTTEWEINNALSPWTSSLSFGSNDYIDCGNDSSLNLTSEITLSAWVKTTDQDSVNNIVKKDDGAGNRSWNLSWRGSGGGGGSRLVFWNWSADGSYNYIYTTGTPASNFADGNWHHVVATYDGTTDTNGAKIYLDGDLMSQGFVSRTGTGLDTTTSNVTIGNDLTASISNVQIFNTALPEIGSNSVETLYNNGSPLALMTGFTSLVSWWKLNNTTTGVEDSKGSNNGTNSGAVEAVGSVSTLNGDSSGMTQANLVQSDLQTVAPYSKYAMDFDGTDYIETSGPNFTTAFSFSCWFKTSNTGTQTIWTASQSSIQKHFLRISGTQFRLRLADSSDPSGLISLDNTLTTADGDWHHVCFTTDGLTTTDGIVVYFDGYPLPVKATLANAGFASTDSNYLGTYSSGGTWAFDGSLSNASFWNTVLTPAQVTEIYNEGLPSDLNSHSAYSNLVSWWQLGENSSYVGGATNPWTFADEKGTNNGLSPNLPEIALTNGVGTTANGVSASMGVGSLVGDAPYSTANAISSGMSVVSRVSGVSNATITTGGTGYSTGNNIATTGGSGTNCTINITTVSGGAITAITINSGGNDYLIGDVLTVSGGNGNATITVSDLNTP